MSARPASPAQALLIWCGALLGTLARRRQERLQPARRSSAVAVAATGVVLTVAANIHGFALLAGIVMALATRRERSAPR